MEDRSKKGRNFLIYHHLATRVLSLGLAHSNVSYNISTRYMINFFLGLVEYVQEIRVKQLSSSLLQDALKRSMTAEVMLAHFCNSRTIETLRALILCYESLLFFIADYSLW